VRALERASSDPTLLKSSNNAELGRGGDGGKAPWSRGDGSARHAPGAEPDRRVTRAGTVLLRNCMGAPHPERRNGITQDRSPVRESRTPGSARGACSNARPYRDRCACPRAAQSADPWARNDNNRKPAPSRRPGSL
jgi:hypothetical protein